MRGEAARTPGGARLRVIREAAGLTQLWVEAEAELGTGYVQRVESGKVRQPERSTLERLLAALGARYSERREVLELFGYTVATPLPTEAEIAWASDACRAGLNEVAFPAYGLDCTTRLIGWNRHLPRLVGASPRAFSALTRRPLLVAWFDPTSPLGAMVAEPAELLPAMLRALRWEFQQFGHEAWSRELVASLSAELPRFRHYWAQVEREPAPVSSARALVPVRLNSPAAGRLEFRLAAESFARDRRFRLVFLFPADPPTLYRCAEWATPPAGAP